jgi:large subunit ribosomal protein L29
MQFARLQARPAAVRGAVVCRAKKMPMADVRAMDDAKIDTKVTELKEELFRIRMKQATKQTFKSSDMQTYTKDIARLLTVKREREIADGVSLRESRRKEKARLVAEGLAL